MLMHIARPRPDVAARLRLEHAARQHLAHPTFEGKAAIAVARPGRAARSFGGEIEKPAFAVIGLREKEAAPVADLMIVLLELMAVIAQRERHRMIIGQGLKPRKMRLERCFVEVAEPYAGGPALIAIAQHAHREIGRLDRIVEAFAKIGMGGRGAIRGEVVHADAHSAPAAGCRREALPRASLPSRRSA